MPIIGLIFLSLLNIAEHTPQLTPGDSVENISIEVDSIFLQISFSHIDKTMQVSVTNFCENEIYLDPRHYRVGWSHRVSDSLLILWASNDPEIVNAHAYVTPYKLDPDSTTYLAFDFSEIVQDVENYHHFSFEVGIVKRDPNSDKNFPDELSIHAWSYMLTNRIRCTNYIAQDIPVSKPRVP